MAQTTAKPGLRERQRQETHGAIRRAAYDLIVADGASSVSVQHICEAAGVSQRTFFNHFRSKDEALLPDFPDFDAGAQEGFVAGGGPDLIAALGDLLSGFVLWLGHSQEQILGPAAMRRLMLANPELIPRAMAVFETQERKIAELVALRTGRDRDDLFCRVASLTASSAMRAAFMAWAEADPADPADLPDPAESQDRLKDLMDQSFSIFHELAASQ
jgi:AcrR family transcriptional regulator